MGYEPHDPFLCQIWQVTSEDEVPFRTGRAYGSGDSAKRTRAGPAIRKGAQVLLRVSFLWCHNRYGGYVRQGQSCRAQNHRHSLQFEEGFILPHSLAGASC